MKPARAPIMNVLFVACMTAVAVIGVEEELRRPEPVWLLLAAVACAGAGVEAGVVRAGGIGVRGFRGPTGVGGSEHSGIGRRGGAARGGSRIGAWRGRTGLHAEARLQGGFVASGVVVRRCRDDGGPFGRVFPDLTLPRRGSLYAS